MPLLIVIAAVVCGTTTRHTPLLTSRSLTTARTWSVMSVSESPSPVAIVTVSYISCLRGASDRGRARHELGGKGLHARRRGTSLDAIQEHGDRGGAHLGDWLLDCRERRGAMLGNRQAIETNDRHISRYPQSSFLHGPGHPHGHQVIE